MCRSVRGRRSFRERTWLFLDHLVVMHAAEDTLSNGSTRTPFRSAGYSWSLFAECLKELAIVPFLYFLPIRSRCSRVRKPHVKTQIVNKGFEQQFIGWRVFELTGTLGRILDRFCIQTRLSKALLDCDGLGFIIQEKPAWGIEGWRLRTGEIQLASLKLSRSGYAKCEPHRTRLRCNHHSDQTGRSKDLHIRRGEGRKASVAVKAWIVSRQACGNIM